MRRRSLRLESTQKDTKAASPCATKDDPQGSIHSKENISHPNLSTTVMSSVFKENDEILIPRLFSAQVPHSEKKDVRRSPRLAKSKGSRGADTAVRPPMYDIELALSLVRQQRKARSRRIRAPFGWKRKPQL